MINGNTIKAHASKDRHWKTEVVALVKAKKKHNNNNIIFVFYCFCVEILRERRPWERKNYCHRLSVIVIDTLHKHERESNW